MLTRVYHVDVRQCLLYDSDKSNARLLGVEYMVTPRLFKTLPPEERRLWHTHEYEVKSGMLIMPSPAGMPNAVWEVAETAEMRDVIPLYGKVYHFWQVDRGDPVPMGPPQLMGSFLSEEKVKLATGGKGLEELVRARDEKYGVDTKVKAEKRKDIEGIEKDPGELHSCLYSQTGADHYRRGRWHVAGGIQAIGQSSCIQSQ